MDMSYVSTNLLGVLTAGLLFARQVYWFILEIEANAAKPKTRIPRISDYSVRFAANFVTLLIILQLLGVQILPFENNLFIQTVGFVLTVIGIVMSIAGRRDLGTNWAHAAEFQIRKGQELVTHGIYRKVRHPIYGGLFLTYVGAELVAGSYLFLILFIVLIIVGYRQAAKEEELLIRQYGKKYLDYMERTKMFFPGIW